MSENQNSTSSDPLATSRVRDAQLAELKQQAVQVAAGTQDSATGAHRYAVPRETAEAWADFWIRQGAHVMPLRMDGSKKPVNNGWPDARAMTRDDIATWLMKGGGIGINLGKTGWAVLDADNAKATELFRRAGLVRTVITANAQVPDHPKGKTGGGQFILRAPVGIDPDTLHSRPFELPCGAKGDMLGGRRYIVAAPTRLDEADGRSYMPDPDGIWGGTGGVMQHVGPWAIDPNAVGNIGALEPLRGLLGPKQPHERVYDEAGEWRTPQQQQIDEKISWEQVFDCEEGRKFTVETTDSCGCDVYAYAGQTSKDGRGLTAHDGCSWGWYGATWSGTARAHYDLPQTTDRLRIAARLRHLDTDGEVALGRSWGVGFGGFRDFADTMDEAAERYEDFADDPEKCTGTAHVLDPDVRPTVTSFNPHVAVTRPDAWRVVPADRQHWIRQAGQCRAVARQLRSGKPAAPQANGETYLNGPVLGAEVPPQPVAQPADPSAPIDAETVELPGQEPPTDTAPAVDAVVSDETSAASSSTSTTPAVDDAIQGEIVTEWEDGDQEMWRRTRAIEAELRGERDPDTKLWRGMTPGLGRIANIAESRGVYYHGLIEAVLPRVSARVPPRVVIAPRSGLTQTKAEGMGLSYNSLLFGAPATAKTTTQTTAAGAVPLPEGVEVRASGTAEGLAKAARKTVGGGKNGGRPETLILATSVYAETDEVSSVLAEINRDSSKYVGFTNSTFFGNTTVGQTTSEDARNVSIPAHGARFAQQVGAQPQLCGLIWKQAGSGLDARFAGAFTGSVDPSERGPLYGKPVPELLPNGLPWDPPPGIPFGFRRVPPEESATAGEPDISTLEVKVVPPETEAPEWIFWPEGSQDGADAAAERSAHRSRYSRQAMLHDMDSSRTEGHEAVRTVKAAVLLAALDGLKQPEEVHWRAAELLTEATILAAEESIAQSEAYDLAQARKSGRTRGVELANGKAAAEQEATDAVVAAADALYAKLTRPRDGVLVKGKKAKGFGGQATYGELTAASAVRPEHRPYRDAGMALLIQQERISVAATGSDRREYTVTAVGAVGQLTAAPAIGSISA